jgi:hypothetical protein
MYNVHVQASIQALEKKSPLNYCIRELKRQHYTYADFFLAIDANQQSELWRRELFSFRSVVSL